MNVWYLENGKAIVADVNLWLPILAIAAILAIAIGVTSYDRVGEKIVTRISKQKTVWYLAWLSLLASLVVIVRGGLKIINNDQTGASLVSLPGLDGFLLVLVIAVMLFVGFWITTGVICGFASLVKIGWLAKEIGYVQTETMIFDRRKAKQIIVKGQNDHRGPKYPQAKSLKPMKKQVRELKNISMNMI